MQGPFERRESNHSTPGVLPRRKSSEDIPPCSQLCLLAASKMVFSLLWLYASAYLQVFSVPFESWYHHKNR